MHSFDAPSHKVTFLFNGSYDGDVTIYHLEEKTEVTIPFDDIKAFVAGYVSLQRISWLEQADDDEILGVPKS